MPKLSSNMIRRTPNATSALLQKVSSQLKGERVKKDEEEDDLNAYLKSLTQKTSQQRKSVNFEDVGEISISSEMDTSSSQVKKRPLITSGNKFLKKKQDTDMAGSKFLKKPQASSASPVPTVSSHSRPGTAKSQGRPQSVGRDSTTSALNKAAVLSNKFAQRSAEMRNVLTLETDTSESFSTPRPQTPLGRPVSADSDSFKLGKDGNKFLKKKESAADKSPARSRSPAARSPKSTSPVPNQKKEKKNYLKKKKEEEVVESKTKASPFTLRSSLKYSTDVVLSSGEESLAEFISGLDKKEGKGGRKQADKNKDASLRRSPSPHSNHRTRSPSSDTKPPPVRRSASPSTPNRSPSPVFRRRSPSPRYRRSRSSGGESDFGDSLQSDVIEEIKDEEDSEDIFKVNLMDADSLEPVLVATPKKSASPKAGHKSRDKTKKVNSSLKQIETSKKRKTKNSKKKSITDDIFSSFGIQSVEDLFDGLSEEKIDVASVASEMSEIKTQSESEEIQTEKPSVLGQKKSQVSYHSIIESEIKTQGSRSSSKRNSYSEDFEDSISERIGHTSTKASRLRSLSEIHTRYSGDDTAVEDYTEDFGSDTESIATISKTSVLSEKTITDSFRSETISETYTPSERTPPPRRNTRTKTAEVQTQEPGLHYSWNPLYTAVAGTSIGTAFTDPTPIATHVVSPDSLEAMTAYNPSMLALHDMLKQQLQLTKDFLQTQQYLYKCMADNIDSSYKYTTLEETKQYIKKHRKKKLTFKEALKMVDRECG